jgi:excisionase family DNA binding protein
MKAEMQNDAKPPVTKDYLAAHFAVTKRTVENWMAKGLIPYWKIGRLCRFDLDHVKAALNERCGRNLKTS